MQLVTKAAKAPTAANAGAIIVPTAPLVNGISTIVSPFSFLIIILLALPFLINSFTFSTTSFPETLNSSFVLFFSRPRSEISNEKFLRNFLLSPRRGSKFYYGAYF